MREEAFQNKMWCRYTPESFVRNEPDPEGRLFAKLDDCQDLTDVRCVHHSVDTVRQLYHGKLRPAFRKFDEKHNYQSVHRLCGSDFMFGGGGGSGYRYRLQNNEVGLVILFGSAYRKDPQYVGANLKIDCSPAFLLHREPAEVQEYLNAIASELLLNGWKPSGVAIHICADVQGWAPPLGFERRLTTRARLANTVNGLLRLDLQALEGVKIFGPRETFTWGSRSSVEFQVYNKSVKNQKDDKVDFWNAVWSRAHDSDGVVLYDDAQPVWRLEFRFHHTVIQQMGDGYGSALLTYLECAELLDDMWRYGLANNRLDCSKDFVDPFWQYLYQDLELNPGAKRWMAKRVYKKLGSCEQRNVCLAVGNALSVYARRSLTTTQVIAKLRGAGLWGLYCRYCKERGLDPAAEIAQGLNRRRLIGMAA